MCVCGGGEVVNLLYIVCGHDWNMTSLHLVGTLSTHVIQSSHGGLEQSVSCEIAINERSLKKAFHTHFPCIMHICVSYHSLLPFSHYPQFIFSS